MVQKQPFPSDTLNRIGACLIRSRAAGGWFRELSHACLPPLEGARCLAQGAGTKSQALGTLINKGGAPAGATVLRPGNSANPPSDKALDATPLASIGDDLLLFSSTGCAVLIPPGRRSRATRCLAAESNRPQKKYQPMLMSPAETSELQYQSGVTHGASPPASGHDEKVRSRAGDLRKCKATEQKEYPGPIQQKMRHIVLDSTGSAAGACSK